MITGLSASLGSDLAAAGGSLPFAPACATLYVSPENTISEVLIMKIDHIALCVNDLEAARDFFVRYFGAKPNGGYHNTKTGFRSYFLSFDDGARLELANKPGTDDAPKALPRTGYAHIAFSVGSREKVDALTAWLKEDGYALVSGPRTTGDGYYESCIVALEDNLIEITV